VAIAVHATVIDLLAARLNPYDPPLMPELPMGANAPLRSRHGDVVISHALDPALDVNLTAFLVGADGRVRSDADMVFYNQPEGENACARYHAPAVAGPINEFKFER
jgi:hypothetical protein